MFYNGLGNNITMINLPRWNAIKVSALFLFVVFLLLNGCVVHKSSHLFMMLICFKQKVWEWSFQCFVLKCSKVRIFPVFLFCFKILETFHVFVLFQNVPIVLRIGPGPLLFRCCLTLSTVGKASNRVGFRIWNIKKKKIDSTIYSFL